MTEYASQSPEPPFDVVGELPAHLAQKVLIHLDGHRDYAAASITCRRWCQVVAEEEVWQAGYSRRFPAWGCEQALDPAAQQAADALSWAGRYRWRLSLDRAWSRGRRHLAHLLDAHHAWVNTVRLIPGVGVASGGSEGAVNVWSLGGALQHHDTTHSQAVWALDAGTELVVSGAMDGWVNAFDLGAERVVHRLPVGWRGPAALPPNEADWQSFDVVTSVQLLPGGQQVLAGCMDGTIQLLDLRCHGGSGGSRGAAVGLSWGERHLLHTQQQHYSIDGGAQQQEARFWWRTRESSARLCAARCHEHLMVAGGDAAAVSLHDLRMGGACFAELALPGGGGQSTPAVFAMDLLWPRLATGGDRGQVQVWDLSKLDAAPGVLPLVPAGALPPEPRVLYSLWGGPEADGSGRLGSSTPRQPEQPPLQQQQQQQAAAPPSWPSPGLPPRVSPPVRLSSAGPSSLAALSLDCLVGTNERLLRPFSGLQMGCVYSVKLLEDWRVLTADHAGWVRCWNSSELVGGPLPCLTQRTPFAPSLDDPASSLVDLEDGAMRPVGMHCLDACLTHLAVAGRDSVVRLYSYDELGSSVWLDGSGAAGSSGSGGD